MTGHLLFKKIDPIYNTTHSKIINKLIRNKIGFKNLIITDDICMKALRYSLKENIQKAFKAGCNLVLHCNGNIKEMRLIARISPKVDKFIIKKTSEFYKLLS